MSFADTKSAREILSALRANPNVNHAGIYDKDGRVFAAFSRDATQSDFSPPPVQTGAITIARNNMVLFQPMTLKGEFIGTIFIEANLKDLDELHALRLSGTAVSDAGLAHLVNLKSLRTLIVGGSRITKQGLAALTAQLPKLTGIRTTKEL